MADRDSPQPEEILLPGGTPHGRNYPRVRNYAHGKELPGSTSEELPCRA